MAATIGSVSMQSPIALSRTIRMFGFIKVIGFTRVIDYSYGDSYGWHGGCLFRRATCDFELFEAKEGVFFLAASENHDCFACQVGFQKFAIAGIDTTIVDVDTTTVD